MNVSASSTWAGRTMAHSAGVIVKVEQTARQRVRIGTRHRAENVAFDAAQGEQRQERRDDDRGGKKDRPGHVSRRGENRMLLHVHDSLGGARRFLAFRETIGVRQPPEDRFDHDDGGIDDQPKIDRTDRQQIGRFSAKHQDAHRKEQRERNRRTHDDRAA